jgi:hypothetical protein
VIELRGGCRRHRAALTDFVDRGLLGASAKAAFDHLERCDACVIELESTALTIMALRRLGDAMARYEPRPDAWPRLRARIEAGGAARFRGRTTRAAHLAGAALVGCLVASVALSGAGPVETPSPVAIPEAARFDAPTENPSRSRPRPAVISPEQVRIDVARWTGPDGLGITLSPASEDGARPSAPI